MNISKWKNLDIQKINKQRALILCNQRINGEKLAHYFRSKGMLAICFTHHREFYLALSRSEGCFALISNQYDQMLLDVMPDFIVSKFGCPVVVFSEFQSENSKTEFQNKNEVISVKGGFQQILHTIKHYEKIVLLQKELSLQKTNSKTASVIEIKGDDQILEEIFEDSEHSYVPIEPWWVISPLPCKAYLSLDKNNKKILFIHEGEKLRTEAFTRFAKRFYSHLAIEKKDREKFLEYRRRLSLTLST